jgi:hypothetical protein
MSGTTSDAGWIGATTDEIDETDRYELLADDERRAALAALRGRSDPVDLDELTAAVAGRETGDVETDDATRKRVRISLHHVHLPKLSEAGVCTYDREETVVSADSDAVDSLAQ